MVIGGSGRSRDRQVGIHGPQQPFGDFHSQGVCTLVTPLVFERSEPALKPAQSLNRKLVWTHRSRHNALPEEHHSDARTGTCDAVRATKHG